MSSVWQWQIIVRLAFIRLLFLIWPNSHCWLKFQIKHLHTIYSTAQCTCTVSNFIHLDFLLSLYFILPSQSETFNRENEVGVEEERCYGKRCTANEHCCPNSVCVDVDGGMYLYYYVAQLFLFSSSSNKYFARVIQIYSQNWLLFSFRIFSYSNFSYVMLCALALLDLRYAKIWYSCRVDYLFFFVQKCTTHTVCNRKQYIKKTGADQPLCVPRPATGIIFCLLPILFSWALLRFLRKLIFNTHAWRIRWCGGAHGGKDTKERWKKLEHPLTIGRQKSVYSSLFNLAFGCWAHALIRAPKLNRISDCWHGTVTRDIFKTKNKTEN